MLARPCVLSNTHRLKPSMQTNLALPHISSPRLFRHKYLLTSSFFLKSTQSVSYYYGMQSLMLFFFADKRFGPCATNFSGKCNRRVQSHLQQILFRESMSKCEPRASVYTVEKGKGEYGEGVSCVMVIIVLSLFDHVFLMSSLI